MSASESKLPWWAVLPFWLIHLPWPLRPIGRLIIDIEFEVALCLFMRAIMAGLTDKTSAEKKEITP